MFNFDRVSRKCYLCGKWYFHYPSTHITYNEDIENNIKFSDLYCLVCEQNRYRSEKGFLVVSDKDKI